MKSHASSPHRSPIFYQILAYLTEHPHAQDTIEGIVEWWLLEQRIKRATTQVKAALKQLTDENYVITRTDRTGHVYYHLNQRKRQKIRQLISKEF